MSDSLSSLGRAAYGGSVLSAIANPQVVNPLAAYSGAAETAGRIYQLRQAQAQQAIGGILQQATDANGNVDYPKANLLASQAGPVVQMGMQTMLHGNSELQNAQLSRTGATLATYGQAAMSLWNDPSDKNVEATFANLKAAGWPQGQLDAEYQRVKGMSPADRQTYAIQHGMAAMDGLQRWGQSVGTPGVANMPQGAVPYVQAPSWQGGGIKSAPGTIGASLSPGEVVNQGAAFPADERWVKEHPGTTLGQTVHLSGPEKLQMQQLQQYIPPGATPTGAGGGVVTPDGKPVSGSNQPRLLPVPGANAPPAAGYNTPTPAPAGAAPPPAVQQGGPPPAPPGGSGTPYTGGGIGSVLGGQPAPPAPVAPAPPAATVAPPPPAPGPVGNQGLVRRPDGTVGTPGGGFVQPPGVGPRADLSGGVPVASSAPAAVPVGAAAPPSPLVAGDVAAIQRGMMNARGNSLAGPGASPAPTQTAYNAPSFGPGVQEQSEWKASSDRLAADDTAAANFTQTQFPYVQALSQLGKGIVTGPNSDAMNRVAGGLRVMLQKVGIPAGNLGDINERYDAAKKWLANIVTNTPFAAGSDARMAEVLNGNANTSISQAASEDMLKAGIIMQRMTVAANQQWHAMTPQQQSQYGGLYLNFLRGYSNTVDPRAFGLDMYNPAQKANLAKAVKSGSEDDARKFNASRAIASGVGTQQPMP